MAVRVSFFLVLSLNVIFCAAQNRTNLPFKPDQPLRDLSVSQWNADDGLSSNNLTSVFQSSEGLLWITSFNGFMNFDGRYIDIFDRNNIDILETDGFYSIAEAEDGSLLFGSQGSGILRYAKGEFKRLISKEGTIPKSIRTLLKASNGDIFIGSTNEGLLRLRADTVYKYQQAELAKSTIMSLVEDSRGIIWVATDGYGLFTIEPDRIRLYTQEDGLLSNNIEALSIGPDGNVIIGTNKGLQWWNQKSFGVFEELGRMQINALWVDGWNSIWAGTELGLARLNKDYSSFEMLYSKNNTDFVRITSIKPDREGNLWITSNRSGLIRVKETSISNISKPELASNRINIIHEGPNGALYVGSDLNVFNICTKDTCRTITVRSLKDGNGVRDIYVENEQSVWLATYSGIIHVDNGHETVYTTSEGMPAEDFRTILKDSQGNFWFGSRSGGLVKFRDGKIIKTYDRDNGLKSNYILATAEARDGSIYVGTHSGGMSIIRPDDSVTTHHLRMDDAGILLFNIDIDKQGRVWAIANTGPVYFDGDSLRSIALQQDRRSKTYFDWIDDERGNIFLTTNIGVLQLSKDDILGFTQGKVTQVPTRLLDDADGMNNKECTGATRSTRSATGKIYIPTLGGVCVIDPAMQIRNEMVPPIRISHFKTDRGERSLFQPQTEIEPGTIRYSFRYSVLSYATPGRNQFRTMLQGFDKDWSIPVHDSEVEYTNLPPGTYTFRVIGSNDNNVWNEQGASFVFTVQPFFYQTIWFYALVIGTISALLLLLYKWRISFVKKQNEALKKVNAELDRFVYSASHDLRSPLASILGLINVAREDTQWDKQEYLTLIEKSVKKLDSFIGDIIDFSRNARLEIVPEKIDFETFIKDILEDLRYIENYDKISRTVSVNISTDFYTDRKRLRIVLSNVIANAIKHHLPEPNRDNYFSVTISQDKHLVVIQVTDNGPGISEKYHESIFKMFFRASGRTAGSGLGLYIVKETVNKLGGKITLASRQGEGTTFTISLPSYAPTKQVNLIGVSEPE
ncbi:MAG: ATP-binding protein [Cyclobacteriaceae bacterium]|nr:ATP-binding protein [Cyclobacteriaceae bacterium]